VAGTKLIGSWKFSASLMRKYRRIVREKDSRLQGYQICLIALSLLLLLVVVFWLFLRQSENMYFDISSYLKVIIKTLFAGVVLVLVVLVLCWRLRDEVATLDVPKMDAKARKVAGKIKGLFNDKAVADVLKLANKTRYGVEMPEVFVYLESDLYAGYVAIENIASFDSLDRAKIEQKISGILTGKYQKYAITSSELSRGDAWVLYHFEDALTSMRLVLKDENDVANFVSENSHDIRLARDLVWHANQVPHMSIIARTRAGKSVFAGGYLASLMQVQGWIVEYNSAKKDIYVKRYNGKFEPIEIVERAEFWLEEMKKRLAEIDDADAEKYTDLSMQNIAVFFDEIGNLNASLESDKALKKRWETAINALSATGASAGLHIISISQRATKEGFLTGLARTNSSDAVIMLGTAANEATERQYLIAGYEMAKRKYSAGQGIARFDGSGHKWQEPHYFETPLFKHYV